MEKSPKKVLIVDDEPDFLMVLKARIGAEGFEITTASNGIEALNLLQKEVFDVIVTDVLMPHMDGFAFYKQLKNLPSTKDIPVLVLTARGHMEDSLRVAGVDDFIAKPYDDRELIEKVKKLANREFISIQSQFSERVLVVGNDEPTVEHIALLLKKAGCTVDFVFSGDQAISKAVMFLPTVLVIECQIYGIDANEIIHVLRQMKQFQGIPMLVYSFYNVASLGNEDVRQRALTVDAAQMLCMEAGATAYLGRFNEQSFLGLVEKYIHR